MAFEIIPEWFEIWNGHVLCYTMTENAIILCTNVHYIGSVLKKEIRGKSSELHLWGTCYLFHLGFWKSILEFFSEWDVRNHDCLMMCVVTTILCDNFQTGRQVNKVSTTPCGVLGGDNFKLEAGSRHLNKVLKETYPNWYIPILWVL